MSSDCQSRNHDASIPAPTIVADAKLVELLSGIDLPTVIRKPVFPGHCKASLVVATEPGIAWILNDDGSKSQLLDIRSNIGFLGTNVPGLPGLGYPLPNSYDERGLLGMEFPLISRRAASFTFSTRTSTSARPSLATRR